MACRSTAPFRNMTTGQTVTSTIVDPGPPASRPASRTRSTSWHRSGSSASALATAGRPDKLALVPVMGPPNASVSARATGWTGRRTPNFSRSAGERRWHAFSSREHQRQSTRPQCHKRFSVIRDLGNQFRHLAQRGQQHQHRFVGRSALDGENLFYGRRAQRISPKPV